MNKAIEYLKEEHKSRYFLNKLEDCDQEFDDFVINLCNYPVDMCSELDYNNILNIRYIIKLNDKLIRCEFYDNILVDDLICFVEEKEKVVKYYEPIKD